MALFLFFISDFCVYADTLLSEKQRTNILEFTLFNFDNLIADYYEGDGRYAKQLAVLLSDATGFSDLVFLDLLNKDELNAELNAVRYMLKINQDVKQQTGFYFVHQ